MIEDIIQNNNIKYMTNIFEIKYLIGSNFTRDNDKEYRENILSIIRKEMIINKLLVLKDLDVIYKFYSNILFSLNILLFSSFF